MGGGTAAVLEPTYTGYVSSTQDALILFEACLTGILHHVPRRPHDRERSQLVRSGSVFIYEENASGIKRWTDGVTWSPSRILGNFLVYRELDKPFPPGEKKRAMKKPNRRTQQFSRPGEPYPRPQEGPGGPSTNGSSSAYSPTSTSPGSNTFAASGDREVERALVGSLVDSYGFKECGLVKKTMSVTVSGVTHHLVSYYNVEDVMRGLLNPPSVVENLRYIRPRPELTTKQSFRAPVDDVEQGRVDDSDPQALYGYRPTMIGGQGYAMPSPAHPGYYSMPGPASTTLYSAHPHQQGALTTAAYPMASHGLPNTPASNPYMSSHPSAPAPDMPQPKTEDYTYRQPASYGGGFDAINQSMPAQHSMSAAALPPSLNPPPMADRSRPPPNSNPSLFRNPAMHSRNFSQDASPAVDATASGPYGRPSFGVPGQEAQSPLDQQQRNSVGQVPFDPISARRESNPLSQASYYNGGMDRQPQATQQPNHHQHPSTPQQQQPPPHQRPTQAIPPPRPQPSPYYATGYQSGPPAGLATWGAGGAPGQAI